MNATVRPINVRGRPLPAAERNAAKHCVGVLLLREERSNRLRREFVRAELESPIDEQLGQLLPPLMAARVLFLQDRRLRSTSMEVVEERQYYQTWDMEHG